MATIDYKEKYEQTLERARQFSEKPYLEDSAGIVEYIFPELKESDDERIRKEILDFCKNRAEKYSNDPKYKNISAWIAWLEKKGEPVEINPTEFDLHLNKLLKQFETLPKEDLVNCLSFYLNVVQNDGTYRSLRSKWKPSDDQIDALHYVTNFDYGGYKAALVSLYEQLKKL